MSPDTSTQISAERASELVKAVAAAAKKSGEATVKAFNALESAQGVSDAEFEEICAEPLREAEQAKAELDAAVAECC
jgi:hypothetical protein